MNDDKYDYAEQVRSDVRDFLKENYDSAVDYDQAYDDMFVADSVTGNSTGSYYCSTWKAESALCHNSNLLAEAEEEFGVSEKRDPETLDVVVRCYVLGQVLAEELDAWNAGFATGEDDAADDE